MCKSYREGGGGVPDGKNEIKEHITPYFGVGEHEFNSRSAQFRPNIPLFDPLRSPRARDKNSVILAPPVKSDFTTRWGDLKIGGVGTLISR